MFDFWGKADPNQPGPQKWHLLVYHALDVAAVAAAWWDSCMYCNDASASRMAVDFRWNGDVFRLGS